MRAPLRCAAHALVAAVLIGSLCGFGGWLGRIGGFSAVALNYISSTFTSAAAQSGWITATPTDCPFTVNGTAKGAGSTEIDNISTTGLAVGQLVYDNDNYTLFPYGVTIAAITTPSSGGLSNGVIQLSDPASAATTAGESIGFWVTPIYPVSQWTWDNTKTTNQPSNALAAQGGEAIGTFAGTGSATITGVNNIYGAPMSPAAGQGWWVTSDAMTAPVQISSITGSAPNYTITLTSGATVNLGNVFNLAQNPITIQPNEPTIIQYRNSAEGQAAAATFNGYIVNTTLNVTSTPTAALAVGTPIYYPTTPADIPQGAYITACPGGVCTGTGAYTISDAVSAPVGSSGSPVALQTMGTVATFHTAYGGGGSGGAFSYNGVDAAYLPGDVYAVQPAIYAGEWQYFTLLPTGDQTGCYTALTTAGSQYVSCNTSTDTAGIGVGDYVRDLSYPAQMAGYISGTTMTVQSNPNPSESAVPSVGELVTGTGVATGTVITACPAAGCAAVGQFTVGCEHGVSGGCASQNVGSPLAPVALTAKGNWPEGTSATVLAVWPNGTGAPSGAGQCPNGTATTCLQVSVAASTTHTAADNIGIATYRPWQTVTVEGITGPINGSGSYRPVIAEDGGNATYNLQAPLYVGNDGAGATVSGLLFRNIDLESDGEGGTSYLSFLQVGFTGTNTFAQMRIEGGVWLGTTGMGMHTADAYIIPEADIYATPSAIDPLQELSGTINLEQMIFDMSGGPAGPSHDAYFGGNPNLTCNFINDWFSKATYGHLLKSRCGTTNVTGSYLQGGPPLGGLQAPQFFGYIVPSGPTGLPTLTVTSMVRGTLIPGQMLTTMGGVASGTLISKDSSDDAPYFIPGSGTPGGTGQYIVDISQTVGNPPGVSTGPVEMEANYYSNNPYPSGPIVGESVDGEFPCGGHVAIENTVLVKNMSGPSTNGYPVVYNAEGLSYILRVQPSVATAFGSPTITFAANTIPASWYNGSEGAFIQDADDPAALPSGIQIGSYNDHSVTIVMQSGAQFTASTSGSSTALNVTAFGSYGTGAIAVGAPLTDMGGLIPAGTVITNTPCGATGSCSTIGTYTMSQAANIASAETVVTGCGGGVCMPIPTTDHLVITKACAFGSYANNSITLRNDDFVAFSPTEDGGIAGMGPMQFAGPDAGAGLPGDTDWPFTSSSAWAIDDNIYAGFCQGQYDPSSALDSGGIPANQSLHMTDFPWYNDSAFDWSGNAHVSLVISPAELTQSFLQNLSPQYADASDTGVEGVLAYVHAAAVGFARTLPIIGAEEVAAGGGSASCGSLYGDLTNVCNDGVAVATEIGP